MIVQLTAKELKYKIPGFSPVLLYGDELNNRDDFLISANCKYLDAEILLFFDSRGISNSLQGSIADQIVKNIGSDKKYLLITRPLEITTWMTLYNFCKLNSIHPPKIITNMGFVDFTPKKMSIIDKSTMQYNCFFSDKMSIVNFIEKYPATDGTIMDLYIQKYPQHFNDNVEDYFKESEFLIINTPTLKEGYSFTRPRPLSFFDGIKMGNEFNESLKLNSRIFNFKDFSDTETYDGVHYTYHGNSSIYNAIVSFL